MKRRYIAFEGNIGSGKTSIAKGMSRIYQTALILEQFKENDFLPLFYKEPERHALPLELWFLAERYKQLEDYFSKGNLFHETCISDYIFSKTRLFAKNNLNEREFLLFTRIFEMLETQIPQPELIVYLHRPIDQLLLQIEKRGRPYEQEIKHSYLAKIQEKYDQYFHYSQGIQVLYLELGNNNLVEDDKKLERLMKIIDQPFSKKIRYVKFLE